MYLKTFVLYLLYQPSNYNSVLFFCVRAFKAENLSRLDHLFYLLFSTNNWTGTASQEGSLPTPVSGTRMLILEEELTADIDMSLAELEAADFDDGVSY